MKARPYVGEHECAMFAAIAEQVATGLNHVLMNGILPENYQGVFQKAAALCREIVDSAYYASNHNNPCREQVVETSGIAVWFSNFTKCHPDVYEKLTYEDVGNYADTLDELAKDEVLAYAYPEEWISAMQTFFFMLSFAVQEECLKEGVPFVSSVVRCDPESKKRH